MIFSCSRAIAEYEHQQQIDALNKLAVEKLIDNLDKTVANVQSWLKAQRQVPLD